MSDRTDRPITSITTVSDVQKIDIHQTMRSESIEDPVQCTDNKTELKIQNTNAPKATAIITTITTGSTYLFFSIGP